MHSVPTDIRFLLGDRCIWRVSRNLVAVGYGLDAILGGVRTAPPSLPVDAHGVRLQSVPADALGTVSRDFPGLIASAPQVYARHYIDMLPGFDAYMAQFSSKTRATLKRKARKLADAGGGTLDVRSFHRPEQLEAFFADALPLSEQTYQARLLDAGLPGHAAFCAEAERLAAADNLRAYILYMHGKAVAYLYLPVTDDVLVYAYLGYDQAQAGLSPGTVLQMQALEALFAENRFRYFDFTEGDGAHKALFGTHQVQCATVFLFKPGIGNRVLLASQHGFNTAVERAGTWLERVGLKARIRKLLRG